MDKTDSKFCNSRLVVRSGFKHFCVKEKLCLQYKIPTLFKPDLFASLTLLRQSRMAHFLNTIKLQIMILNLVHRGRLFLFWINISKLGWFLISTIKNQQNKTLFGIFYRISKRQLKSILFQK